MKAPQPIPYQGSKRTLAPLIMRYFPDKINRLVEPFSGSAAISIAAAIGRRANKFWINDLNEPLIRLFDEIVNNPDKISERYRILWEKQLGKRKTFYINVRDRFNKLKNTEDFLYILARCVKGAVRYNSNGEFNQSADNRRKGKKPENMRKDIFAISYLLKDKVFFSSLDYSKVFESLQATDLVYMDPPYQGTSLSRDHRYYESLDFDRFVENLEKLNAKNISYLISFDGRLGSKKYGKELPKYLGLHKIMIKVGRSTTSTLLGKKDFTYEALYISSVLKDQLNRILPKESELLPQETFFF